jgi:hypothetical protein
VVPKKALLFAFLPLLVFGYWFLSPKHGVQDSDKSQLIEIISAIEVGTKESLLGIKVEELNADQIEFVKSKLLESLLTRFKDDDWKNWQDANRRGLSEAHEFVSNVAFAYPKLGVFLETAAHLFHELFLATSLGRPFQLDLMHSQILANAVDILKQRTQTFLPAQFMFSPDIMNEDTFINIFERVRESLILEYILNNPDNYEIYIPLIQSIEAEYVEQSMLKVIAMVLSDFPTRVSRELRESIVFNELRTRKFESFAERDKNVRQALAEFYVICAVDSLQTGDSIQGAKFLRESSIIQPSLNTVEVVNNYLHHSDSGVFKDTDLSMIEDKSLYKDKTIKAELSWITIILVIIIFCVLPLVVFYFLYLPFLSRSSEGFRNRHSQNIIDNRVITGGKVHKAFITILFIAVTLSSPLNVYSQTDDSFRLEQNVQILLNALDEGTTYSLELVRREQIVNLPEYESTILPLIKLQALKSLISRFVKSDWEDWTHASINYLDGKSPARLYLDNLWTVNQELGSYLETAAYLFHRLHIQTKQGQVFKINPNLQHLIANADYIVPRTPLVGTSKSQFLLPQIAQDISFIAVLEIERCKQVVSYMSAKPREITKHQALLGSVEPDLCANNEITEAVLKFALDVIAQASPKLRNEILTDDRKTKSLSRFAEMSPKLGTAIAQLYVAGALDAIENNDRQQAREMLTQSLAIQSGLSSQSRVREMLGNDRDSDLPIDITSAEALDTTNTRSLLGELSTKSTTTPEVKVRSFPLLSIILIPIGVIGLIFIFITVYQRNKIVKEAMSESEQDDVPSLDEELSRAGGIDE